MTVDGSRASGLALLTAGSALALGGAALWLGLSEGAIAFWGFGAAGLLQIPPALACGERVRDGLGNRGLERERMTLRAVSHVLRLLALGMALAAASALMGERATQTSLPGLGLAVLALGLQGSLWLAKRRLGGLHPALDLDVARSRTFLELAVLLLAGSLAGWWFPWADAATGLVLALRVFSEGRALAKASTLPAAACGSCGKLRLRLMRVLELFSGLGGWRCALGDRGSVAAAYDVSEVANAAYALNHGDEPGTRELATIPLAELAAHGADTWLLSPPCQPFCRMGNHGGLEDRRSRAFRHLMDLFREAPPERLLLENVSGFLGSDAHALLAERIRAHGMHRLDLQACPSRFGLPNQRPRVFVAASRNPLKARPVPDLPSRALADFLDAEEDEALYLRSEVLARHRHGMDFVAPEDRRSTCFIGGYGQRFVGSGSFLLTGRGVRRFSPSEVARLLGLPEGFRFPESLSLEARYRLLGNGLSIPVAAWALDHL